MEITVGPVNVSLLLVSRTETEKTLKLVLKYRREDVSGKIKIFKVRRWISDSENMIWDQEEVLLEEVEEFSEKEYRLPAGVTGSEEYSLKVAFFDSNGVGHAVYPPEYDPSVEERPSQES